MIEIQPAVRAQYADEWRHLRTVAQDLERNCGVMGMRSRLEDAV